MRKLKAFDFWFSLHGFRFGYPFCCVNFFEAIWETNFRADIELNDWYSDEFKGYDTGRLSNERILCPECVVRELMKNRDVVLP